MIDKEYCMSSFLTFRYIFDDAKNFDQGLFHRKYKKNDSATSILCRTVDELDKNLESLMRLYVDDKTAIFLSGGVDSAILASYMPKGAKAYTFRCCADGAIDETERAKIYADIYGLQHEIIDIFWEDYLKYTPLIMRHKAAPVHSIEPQLYKGAVIAKCKGLSKLVIGESADLNFGGMDKLLSKDWMFDEFVQRYTFVEPKKVLQNPVSMLPVYEQFRLGGNKIDFLSFMDNIFSIESASSYFNSFDLAEMDYLDAFCNLYPAYPLDLNRIRRGEPKYMVFELFKKKYPSLVAPAKIPLPRAMDQWLADWIGPTRKEFLSFNIKDFTGDQKWLIFCLEWFLNLCDEGYLN